MYVFLAKRVLPLLPLTEMSAAKVFLDGSPKKQLFVQFHSVDLWTEYHVIFFEENGILKLKALY